MPINAVPFTAVFLRTLYLAVISDGGREALCCNLFCLPAIGIDALAKLFVQEKGFPAAEGVSLRASGGRTAFLQEDAHFFLLLVNAPDRLFKITYPHFEGERSDVSGVLADCRRPGLLSFVPGMEPGSLHEVLEVGPVVLI